MTDHLLDADDRRKHLEFIQSVIARMSAASSSAKSWLLPVVTATYGYALTKHADSVAVLGMCAVALFAFLDANYLKQERAYRQLYDEVANGKTTVEPFSLTITSSHRVVADRGNAPQDARLLSRICNRVRGWFPEPAVWTSWSVGPFYGAFLLLGLLIALKVR